MLTIERNYVITILVLLFAVLNFVYRCWDVFIKKYGKRGEIFHAWTLPLLGIIHSAIGVLAILEYLLFCHLYSITIGGIAFIFFVIGQIIRHQAIFALGSYHSPQIEIKDGHYLIQTFPYNRIRHPYYLGTALEVLSAPLVLNAYFSFLVAIVLYMPALVCRVWLEEDVMKKHFGQLYQRYSSLTNRFIWSNK